MRCTYKVRYGSESDTFVATMTNVDTGDCAYYAIPGHMLKQSYCPRAHWVAARDELASLLHVDNYKIVKDVRGRTIAQSSNSRQAPIMFIGGPKDRVESIVEANKYGMPAPEIYASISAPLLLSYSSPLADLPIRGEVHTYVRTVAPHDGKWRYLWDPRRTR